MFKVEASTSAVQEFQAFVVDQADLEVPSLTAEALLSGARKLFRDPHRCRLLCEALYGMLLTLWSAREGSVAVALTLGGNDKLQA